MTELKELCEKVLRNAEQLRGPLQLETVASEAERLAKACLVLSEVLEQAPGPYHANYHKTWLIFCRKTQIALSKANDICREKE